MTLFYSKEISNTLPLEESKHCILSLRKKINDTILITNGSGTIYSARIKDIKSKLVIYDSVKIIKQIKKHTKIHIAISPPKNKIRFEWFLEKVTEIGVDIISPIICEYSERTKINKSRCEKIIISAMKQSKNCILPILNDPVKFHDIIKQDSKKTYIAHCQESEKKDFTQILQNNDNIRDITLFIGPEGDFSEKELNFAINSGITPVSLGNNRLRTETAGIVGCSMINLYI